MAEMDSEDAAEWEQMQRAARCKIAGTMDSGSMEGKKIVDNTDSAEIENFRMHPKVIATGYSLSTRENAFLEEMRDPLIRPIIVKR